MTFYPSVLIIQGSCCPAHVCDASLRPHRFALAVGSAVFDAMFNGGMATTSTEIELPDVEPAAFLALLK